jgi:acyl-CoA synthetase (NDP forming)
VIPAELFKPRSVVIVGASANPEKLSNKPLRNLLHGGFRGRISVVNPGAKEIDGVASYPTVEAIPEVPDLAFLVVPGEQALEAATACAAAGVKAAIVASTGFAEAGDEGAARQSALKGLTDRFGIRFVGPNTNGIYSTHDRLSLGYNSAHEEIYEAGDVAVVSHSGALFNSIAENMRAHGLGLSKFVAVGNEADLDMLDFFEFIIDDEVTRTILLIVEAIGDGQRFRELAFRAREAGKPVAVLKLGVSTEGAASTAAHSSRLAGSARAYAAFFKSLGVGMVESVESLVAFAKLAQAMPENWKPSTRGLGLVTASGAGGTILADVSTRHDFSIADISSETAARLRAYNAEGKICNPLDVASFGGSRNTLKTAPLLAADNAVEAVIAFGHKLQTWPQREGFAAGLAQSMQTSRKPHLVISPGGLPQDQRTLLDGKVPTFAECASTLDALSALFDVYQLSSDRPHARRIVPTELDRPTVTLNEYDAMTALDEAGIGTVPRALVDDAAAAVAFAENVGWPVVLKGIVDGVAHKSDVGLVRLNIDSPAMLTAEFNALATSARTLTEGEGSASICVQKMVSGGFEVIAGVTKEAPLGHFLLVGLGGRFAEQIDDVHLWAIPASEQSIREQLETIAVGRVLRSARWSRKQSFDELVNVLMRLQNIVLDGTYDVQAIEINPLWLGEGEPVALDALIIRK